jgi:hypothetical protein
VAETTVKRLFYAVGFNALVKWWDRCIGVGRVYVEEYKCFFQVWLPYCDVLPGKATVVRRMRVQQFVLRVFGISFAEQ